MITKLTELTENARHERKWKYFPELAKLLDRKQPSLNWTGPTSVSNNVFGEVNRLLEIYALVKDNESEINLALETIGEPIHRDLMELSNALTWASELFAEASDSVKHLANVKRKKRMNQFEALCKLASEESWCWNLFCTTCGHMHFRYAFSELAAGKTPENKDWLIHGSNTRYSTVLGPLPRNYTDSEKERVIGICLKANIISIASSCKFPDWLGYLGLVLEHMRSGSKAYTLLSSNWASQLMTMVPQNTQIHARLKEIANGDGLLSITDLENCELNIMQAQVPPQGR